MKEIAKEINAITGQSLIMISQSTGKARIDVEASIEAAHKLAERKQADLVWIGKRNHCRAARFKSNGRRI
ncbi:hypothetical protein TPHV1_30127 [Treponema phagedenis]|uniref:Uncharacterized protein n=2 Tax=Treponema phagedenis TaxID=162 RepID=A0A0B7GXC0_TREPH|nr:hypothetical protein [Treponema phagedenis]CEM62232.1 hypothetical protein TPHV1_30127 [Treponema phagedenis]